MDLPTPEPTVHEDCAGDSYDQLCGRLSSEGIPPPTREEILNANRRSIPIEHDDAFITRLSRQFETRRASLENEGRTLDVQADIFMRELMEDVTQDLGRDTQALEESARQARETYYLSPSASLSADANVHWFQFLSNVSTVHAVQFVVAHILPKLLSHESTSGTLPTQRQSGGPPPESKSRATIASKSRRAGEAKNTHIRQVGDRGRPDAIRNASEKQHPVQRRSARLAAKRRTSTTSRHMS